jgi:predicted nuclease of predicted toxin-antitoxin system
MKIELFLDEDVHSGLAHALRRRGYDAIHTQELDRKGRTDSDQLLFATQRERCLFTFNVKDFVILHNQHAKIQQEHWGLLFQNNFHSAKLCQDYCVCFSILPKKQ